MALTPLHQGTPNPPPLSGTRPHGTRPLPSMAQWDLCCTFRSGDAHRYLITNIIECLRGARRGPSGGPAALQSLTVKFYSRPVCLSVCLVLGAITPSSHAGILALTQGGHSLATQVSALKTTLPTPARPGARETVSLFIVISWEAWLRPWSNEAPGAVCELPIRSTVKFRDSKIPQKGLIVV